MNKRGVTLVRRVGGLAVTLVLAVGCGGGGSHSAGAGSGDTAAEPTPAPAGAVVMAPISGFGSVIVNGIRFDDSRASIGSDDDTTFRREDLRIGMMVDVRGSIAADGLSGSAQSIRTFNEVKGPVDSVDVGASRVVVLGQVVQVDRRTLFADVSGLAGLVPGDVVEVHGLRNPTAQSIVATRIEKKNPPTSGTADLRLRGRVASLDAGSGTFSIGTMIVSYGGARIDSTTARSLANGLLVKVRSEASPVGNTLLASRVQIEDSVTPDAGGRTELEGFVSEFVSTQSFVVNGVAIDGSRAALLRGAASTLANGVRVQVYGSYQNGRLQAETIKFEDVGDLGELEIKGSVSGFVDISNFVVRGQPVDASGASIERGTAQQLANGAVVEIKGVMHGPVLRATRVKFEIS